MPNQRKSKEPDDFNDDWEDLDDDGEQTPDYYYCYCCQFSTITDYGGWGCPHCGAIMSPEYY